MEEFIKNLDNDIGYRKLVIYMNRLKALSEEIDERQKLLAKAYKISYVEPDGLINKLFDEVLNCTKVILNDTSDWISWFIFENDWGAKGMQAGYDNSIFEIKTYKELYWLISA